MRSLQARARGRRALRRGGRTIGRASPAPAPLAVRSCAPSALRDGDGGLERLLGGRRVRRIALEQDCAADAVEQRVRPVLAGFIASASSSSIRRKAPSASCPSASSSASRPWKSGTNSLFPWPRYAASASRSPVIPLSRSPSRARAQFECTSPSARYRAIPCSRPSSTRNLRDAPAGLRVATERLVQRDDRVNVRTGRCVTGLVRARQRLLAQRPRPFDIAQSPACQREVARCAGAGIRAEPELRVTIALGIVCPQRLGEVRLCVDEIALEEARHAHVAARDRCLRHPPLVFGVAQEALRGLPRQAELAAQQAAGEQPVIGVESLVRIARLPLRASGRRQKPSSTRRRRSLGNTSSPDRGWSEASAADSPKRSRSPHAASRPRRPPPCPPSRSPCRDGRSPPGRPSGAAPGRPLLPHHSIARSSRPASVK